MATLRHHATVTSSACVDLAVDLRRFFDKVKFLVIFDVISTETKAPNEQENHIRTKFVNSHKIFGPHDCHHADEQLMSR